MFKTIIENNGFLKRLALSLQTSQQAVQITFDETFMIFPKIKTVLLCVINHEKMEKQSRTI